MEPLAAAHPYGSAHQLSNSHHQYVPYTGLDLHYHPAVELARLILRNITVELRYGPSESSAFLVEMTPAFKDFGVVALQEDIGLYHRRQRQGARLHLEVAGHVAIQPDLSWWEDETCVFVGDLKYKAIDDGGITRISHLG
jgi:5-methylcytosine-specific restriction enzyme subunit McrC